MPLRIRAPRWSAATVTLLGAIVFASCSLETEGKDNQAAEQGGAAGEENGGSAGVPEQGGASNGGASHGGASGHGGTSSGGTSSGGASGQGGSSTGGSAQGGANSGGAAGKGGTSSGGSGQGGSSAGGSSGAGVEQQCLDGTDNDADGKKDCEDSDCTSSGFACTALPPGWQGFFRTRTGAYAGAASPLDCPGGAPPSRRYLAPASAAQCSACSCTWGGASCGIPQLACSGSDSTCYDTQFTFDTDCSTCCTINTSTWPQNPYFSCYVEPTSNVTNPGTCTAGAASDFPNKDPWAQVLDVCAVPSTTSGCPNGSSCLSPDAGDYDLAVCIRHDQDVACPAGWTKKAVSYASFTDTRACSSCGCGAPSGVQCTGGSYKFYDTDACAACSNCSQPVTVANGCVDLANHADYNQFSMIIEKPPAPSGGTCQATGGTPTGQLTPGGAETWCCKN